MMNRQIYSNLCLKGIVITNLLACCLTNAMENKQAYEKRVAFAMVLHSRLGQDSQARILSQDLVKDIVKFLEIQEWTEKSQVERDQALVDAERKDLVNRVQILLAAGANAHADNFFGDTLLHLAALHDHEAVVCILLHNNANINAANDFGNTTLHYAAGMDCEAVVNTLLANHANINAVNYFGLTALHSAAESGHDSVVKLLLQHAPDLTTLNIEQIYNLQRRQRLEELINQEAERRGKEFLLASHPHFGQNSPANILSQPL